MICRVDDGKRLVDISHVRHRREAYPQSWDLVRELRERGIPAAISGAGPSVIAFGDEFDVPDGWRRESVSVATSGVRVSR